MSCRPSWCQLHGGAAPCASSGSTSAATLGPDDTVALEASTNTWALADLLGRHAGRVVVSNPLRTRAIASAKRKTDDIDATTLAELLAADYLPPVWQPDIKNIVLVGRRDGGGCDGSRRAAAGRTAQARNARRPRRLR